MMRATRRIFVLAVAILSWSFPTHGQSALSQVDFSSRNDAV
jgi:hypothetical protein